MADRETTFDRVHVTAAVATLVGFGGLLVYPTYRFLWVDFGPRGYPVLGIAGILLTAVWATLVSWGTATIHRGRVRSLTPARAAVAPLLAPLPFAIETFRKPRTDVVPAPEYIQNWTPPTGPLDLLFRTFEGMPYFVVAPAFFLVIGVAVAHGRRRWALASATVLFLAAVFHDAVATTLSNGVFGELFRAAVPGFVLLYVGYRLAVETGEDGTQVAADPGESNPSTD